MSENKSTIDFASCFFVVKEKGYRVNHILQNFRYTASINENGIKPATKFNIRR